MQMKVFLLNLFYNNYFETLSNIDRFFSVDFLVLQLSAFFSVSFLGALILCKLLLSRVWFLSALKKLSKNLWIYFVAAFPFYFSRSVLFLFENPSCKWWEVLLVGVSSLFFLFLIRFLFLERGSDKLYNWLLFNTRIRIALVNFILLSLFFFCYFWEDITTLSSLLSLSVVANLDYLDGLLLPIFVRDILKSLLLVWCYFLFGFLYVMVLLAQAPFLVIISHYLASGVLLRGLSLYPSLLEFFNWPPVAENSVETTKVMGRGTKITLITVPEILGKSAVRPKSFRSFGVARPFATFSKYGLVDTKVYEFFKKEPSWKELKKLLPFSLVEETISKFPPTATTIYQKDFIVKLLLEELTGKSRVESFEMVYKRLGLDKLSKDKLYELYGLTHADLVNRNWSALNGEDLANAEESYKLSLRLISEFNLQDVSLLVQYTKTTSCYDMAASLSDTWTQNFPQTLNYQHPASRRLFIIHNIVSQVAFGSVPTSFEVSGQGQQFFDSPQGMLTKGSESESIQKIKVHFRNLGNPIVDVFPVTKIYGGDVRVLLQDGREENLEITKIFKPYASFILDPTEEKGKKFLRSVATRLLAKHLGSEANLMLDLPLIFQTGDEVRALLEKGKYLEEAVTNSLLLNEQVVDESKNLLLLLKRTESRNEVLRKIHRLTIDWAELKRIEVDPIKNLGLDKSLVLTSAIFKK